MPAKVYSSTHAPGNFHKKRIARGFVPALAHYLIKETRKTFKEAGSPSKRRWNPSRNLKKPVIKKEIIKSNEWRKEPKAIKGYMLEKNSIQEGFHDITGWPYQKYTMIKIQENKRC
jgi:hypothetical protein